MPCRSENAPAKSTVRRVSHSGFVLNTEDLIADPLEPAIMGRRAIVELWNLARSNQKDRSKLDLFDIYDGRCVNGNAGVIFQRRRKNTDRQQTAFDGNRFKRVILRRCCFLFRVWTMRCALFFERAVIRFGLNSLRAISEAQDAARVEAKKCDNEKR